MLAQIQRPNYYIHGVRFTTEKQDFRFFFEIQMGAGGIELRLPVIFGWYKKFRFSEGSHRRYFGGHSEEVSELCLGDYNLGDHNIGL